MKCNKIIRKSSVFSDLKHLIQVLLILEGLNDLLALRRPMRPSKQVAVGIEFTLGERRRLVGLHLLYVWH